MRDAQFSFYDLETATTKDDARKLKYLLEHPELREEMPVYYNLSLRCLERKVRETKDL